MAKEESELLQSEKKLFVPVMPIPPQEARRLSDPSVFQRAAAAEGFGDDRADVPADVPAEETGPEMSESREGNDLSPDVPEEGAGVSVPPEKSAKNTKKKPKPGFFMAK